MAMNYQDYLDAIAGVPTTGNPYGDYTNPPTYGGGGYGEQISGDQSGYKGMPVPPPNPNLTTMPISNPGMGALNPNMGNVGAIMGTKPGGTPNMGSVNGVMGGGRPLFSPGQNVLYRPASSYGVPGNNVYPATYQAAMGDLNGRLKAYQAAIDKQTGESVAARPGPSTNSFNTDRYQQIADQWAREQRAAEDQAAIVAQQQRNPALAGNPNVPSYNPNAGRPQGTSPAFSGNATIPEHLYDDTTGKTYVSERFVPDWVKATQAPQITPDGKRWYEMPSTGTNSTYQPYYPGAPTSVPANPAVPTYTGAAGGGGFSGGRRAGGGGSGGFS